MKITDKQVLLFRRLREKGLSQETAAAKSGMTAKTARNYEVGSLPSQMTQPRGWRTRKDPFEDVWISKVEPMLERDTAGALQATTILEQLKLDKPGVYTEKELRTLQRRVRDWRALRGPKKEVFFPQVHRPGQEAQLDFTHATELGVTIDGAPLAHLFFELILTCSGHRYVQIAYSENFETLSDGLQAGFWAFGGVTERVCHDSLSAATHELKKTGGRALTRRFAALLEHLRVGSRRINVRRSNENGVVESGHHTLKTALAQALIIRDSREFATLELYLTFVDGVVSAINQRCAARFVEEQSYLRELPTAKVPSYTDFDARVSRWSIIRVATQVYTVPSRLIEHKVTVRLHPTEVEVIYKGKSVDKFPRLQGRGVHRIDYRHIIHSLVRKPGAFENYRYREELFPSLVFRKAFDAFKEARGERGHVDYLQTLCLAAKTMESDVESALETLLESKSPFVYADVEALAAPVKPRVEDLVMPLQPTLEAYDALLEEVPCG